jgi:hypothetical protein
VVLALLATCVVPVEAVAWEVLLLITAAAMAAAAAAVAAVAAVMV